MAPQPSTSVAPQPSTTEAPKPATTAPQPPTVEAPKLVIKGPQPAREKVSTVQSQNSLFTVTVVAAVIVLIILVFMIFWLGVPQKKLKYTIENSSMSGYNLTNNGHLNASFHFLLRAKNPDGRVSYYYDKINITLSYEGVDLSVGNLDPFYQRRRNVTDLELNMVANIVAVNVTVAKNLTMERASGNVKLKVKINGEIRKKIGLFKVRRTLDGNCGPFAVPFSNKSFDRVPCKVQISD